jgi:hypothetical protein
MLALKQVGLLPSCTIPGNVGRDGDCFAAIDNEDCVAPQSPGIANAPLRRRLRDCFRFGHGKRIKAIQKPPPEKRANRK